MRTTAVLCCVLALGLGSDAAGQTSRPRSRAKSATVAAGAQVRPRDGTWSGSIEGAEVRFVVANRGTTVHGVNVSITYTEQRGGYVSSGTVSSSFGEVATVVGNTFVIGGITGTFTSPTNAQGTASLTTTQTVTTMEPSLFGGPSIPETRLVSHRVQGRWVAALGGRGARWDESFSVDSLNDRIRKGETQVAMELIRKNPRLATMRGSAGQTPLHAAAMAGHVAVAGELLARGASLAARNALALTPLGAAAEAGRSEMYDWLIARGSAVTLGDAVRMDDAGRVDTILARRGTVAPMDAARYVKESRSDAMALRLLARSERGGAKHDSGLLLAWAVSKGFRGVVARLLDTGVSICSSRVRDAVLSDSPSMVSLLLEHGASLDDTSQFHGTLLHAAAASAGRAMLDLLVQRGLDVNADNAFLGTPLHVAAKAGRKEIVEALLDKGANINAHSFHGGGTPLRVARDAKRDDVARILEARGAEDRGRQ